MVNLKNKQYYKFCAYGFLKNLRLFDAFLLLFLVKNGMSFSQIGVLYAVREITTNFAEIPSGIIADSYGRKKSLLFAFSLYILSFIAFYISTNFSLLLMAMFLYGIGDAFRSGTHKGMIMDYLEINNWQEHKIFYYGNTRSWSQKGSAISALVAGVLLYFSGSLRFIFLLSIVPYLLNFINVMSYPEMINYSRKGNSESQRYSWLSVIKDLILSVKERRVFALINLTALHTAFLESIKDYIQLVMINVIILIPILSTVTLDKKNGLFIGILYFIIYNFTSLASKYASEFARNRLLRVSHLTLLIGLGSGFISGFFIFHEYWILALVSFALIYLLENLRKPILTGMLSDEVPNGILTSVISAQSFYATMVTATLAIIFGILADNLGIGHALMFVSGGLALFAFIFTAKNTLIKTSS